MGNPGLRRDHLQLTLSLKGKPILIPDKRNEEVNNVD